MRSLFYVISLLVSLTIAQTGCDKEDAILRNTLVHVFRSAHEYRETTWWHQKHAWKAEDFFDDPKIIALCKAIDAKNIRKIDRLVADGADASAKGKGNMTPLLWAFTEGNQEVFKRILEHGADPNVVITSDFNTRGIHPGESVLSIAAGIAYPHFFKYVMQHGGNPNLRDNEGRSPLMSVLCSSRPNKKEEIQFLIDAGADLDYENDSLQTVLVASVSSGNYSITLQLLEAGASFNYYWGEKEAFTILHVLVHGMSDVTRPEEKEYYAKVIRWLETNGADFEGAKQDRANWRQYGKQSSARMAELKKRYEDDLAKKQAANEHAQAEMGE